MRIKILVVDDDPLYIDLVHDVVTQSGHSTISAESGARALELLEEYDVQLILSDIEMPVMGGLTLYRRVRAMAKHARTPFVFLSGTTRVEMLEAVAAIPDVRLITKAQLVAELPALLEELSGQS
jgi:CheY-like chemotaxis protein